MLARQGYEALAPLLQQSLDEKVSDRAEQWLRDEVCPVVEELARDAVFRQHVRWSLDHLRRRASAAERRLVERVDESLSAIAERLSAVMKPSDASCSAEADEQEFLLKLAPADRAAVRLIATRPWIDLTCENDVLHPWQDLFLIDPNAAHTQAFRERGELRIPLGDYVTRMMLARVDYWKALLDRIFSDVFFGSYGSSPSLEQAREELFSAKLELDQTCEQLKRACTANEFRLREACLVLVQVHAGYAPEAKLDWLDLSPRFAESQRGSIRSCIRRHSEIVLAEPRNGEVVAVGREHRSLCDPTILRQIAAALEGVISLFEMPDGDLETLNWALARASLVMVDDSPKAVYWNGQLVAEEAWDKYLRAWDLLWKLARHRGRVVDQTMLMNPDKQAIRSRRNRLGRILRDAMELDALIETRRGGGYLLDLKADKVMLLSRDGKERLELCHARTRT